MQNVLLAPNPLRDTDFSVTRAVAELLRAEGLTLFITEDLAADAMLPEYISIVPRENAMDNMELVICFGGDGTILFSAGEAAVRGLPILGINVGNTGFMVELEQDEIELVKRIRTGDYSLDMRMMLSVSVLRGGETIYTSHALNDAVVNKGAISRMLDLDVYVGDIKMTSFSGDGLIISTPTGSTAYSMSAGGPIIEPHAENIIFTPVCAHALNIRALVLSSDRRLVIRHGMFTDNTAYLSVDGGQTIMLKSCDEVHVGKSDLYTRLVRLNRRSFYEIINNKLNKTYR